MFEKPHKRFFHGKWRLFWWKNNHRDLFSIPLQQMLDINDLIWYCNEIRRQIEKTRYHVPNNHHPLLKYVRSNSFVPTRTNSHQPVTTTTTAPSSSSYSFSNVLSNVIDCIQSYRIYIPKESFRQVHILQPVHIHHHRCLMFNNNSKWNVLKWSKGSHKIMDDSHWMWDFSF